MEDTTKKPDPNESLTGNEDFGSSDTDAAEGMPELDPNMLEQLEALQKKIERADELEREVAEWKTRYMRLQADFESFRRRMSDEAQEAKTKGEANAVEAMLGTLDDITRATEAGVKDPATLIPGLESVKTNFLKALASFGCEPVPGKGEAFDPNVHEAIGVAPGPKDDVIVEVYQTGFILGGKLVRPARVLVSRAMN
jgi:molecular chaperone GrpE